MCSIEIIFNTHLPQIKINSYARYLFITATWKEVHQIQQEKAPVSWRYNNNMTDGRKKGINS